MGFKWTEAVYKAFGPVKGVDKEEMSILVAIAHCTNDITNAGFPSTTTLGRMTHISRSTIFDRLNTLEAKGYLSYESGGFRDGRQYANEYTINLPAAKTPSAAETALVPSADSPGPSERRETVREADTNKNINSENNRNSDGSASPAGTFRLMGVGVPGVSGRPEPTTTGKLMDFCRLSSQEDRRELMKAAMTKGQEAVERLLAALKSSGQGRGLNSAERKRLVLAKLGELPDEN